MQKRELGMIEDAWLGIEDHGILTCWLMFNFGGSGQGFGGYSFQNFDKEKNKAIGSAGGTDFILRVLNAVGVSRWEELKGKEMWCERDSENFTGNIIAIEAPKYRKNAGRFAIKDWQNQWFPKEK